MFQPFDGIVNFDGTVIIQNQCGLIDTRSFEPQVRPCRNDGRGRFDRDGGDARSGGRGK